MTIFQIKRKVEKVTNYFSNVNGLRPSLVIYIEIIPAEQILVIMFHPLFPDLRGNAGTWPPAGPLSASS